MRFFILFACAFSAFLTGCGDYGVAAYSPDAEYGPDGIVMDIGTTKHLELYFEKSGGMGSQAWSCDGEHDHVESSDSSIVLVTAAAYKNIDTPSDEVAAIVATFTALKPGTATLISTCSGYTSIQPVIVNP